MFKKLVCGALIGASLICGVGCTSQETVKPIEVTSKIEIDNSAIIASTVKTILFQETSGSMTLSAQINEWLLENPEVEIVYIDYEVHSGSYGNRAMIIYKTPIVKGE